MMDALVTYVQTHGEVIVTAFRIHFVLFLVSMILSTLLGLSMSIFITSEGREKVGQALLTVTGAAQAVPSIAVVALAFLFVGIGAKPAIIALVLYSLVPIVFNATSGILSVPPRVVEAARGLGLTKSQILWKVKIPLAVPVILSGIRSAAAINIGTVTIAAVIGGGGLGDLIYSGLKNQKLELIIVGAGLSAFMAICVDTILGMVEKKITPRGLQVTR
ncbi:MAG TPA: ABC transporter permease [Synergistaceae bacterium]|jgi:osmoprotectant transport system permease protein|nr:ABC transporter permease [Synergistaceae bacterium]HPJ25405.1 ABC transporter permease [Synergistaceae bacterium]HPQ36926.1 ABC transporter permease [Synergistaceae bacterium]